MIQVRHLSKRFGATVAVRDVSFDVPRGEVLGFLGPNGAGKTTTMRVLTGYIPPTEGSASVAGHDLLEDSLEVRRRVGYLPESAPLYGDMETVDFLRFVADLRGVPPAEMERRIDRMVKVCGLEKVVGRVIHHLSKGYRQRVGLAQAMIHDPDILILDEPTSGLDPNQIIEIRELIRELGREKTVILSTHILPEVQATCTRVVVINEGRLVANGPLREILAKHNENAFELLLQPGSGPLDAAEHEALAAAAREKLAEIPSVTAVAELDGRAPEALSLVVTARDDEDPRREIFGCARDNGWALLGLHRRRIGLEEAFRRLTR